MDWLNLHTSILDSPQVLGAEPLDRATWLMLLRYCIGQENGGTISGCAAWKDRKWQQLARVTQAEVKRVSELWTWQGDDHFVWGYPLELELELRRLREIGRMSSPAKAAAAKANGSLGGRPTKTQQETQHETEQETQQKTHAKPIEGNRREGKGIEGEVEAARRLCELHPRRDLSQPALRAAAAAVRKHGFELVAEGVRAYAAAVGAWTPAARLQFVKNAADFFGEEIWNQPAANWGSRHAQRTNGHHRPINVGGRKPAGIMTFDDEP